MEIGVRVEAEDPLSGSIVHCCSAYLTFVALDAHGKPCPIPELVTAENPTWERRAKEAQMRRDNRLTMRKLRKQEQQNSR